MEMSRWQKAGAVVCLIAGPAGQLAQYLVSPVKEGNSASSQVAAAAAHASAMRIGTVLDVLLLLLIPAVLYAGSVAGGARSRLALAGTAVSFVSVLGAGYLLAQDVVIQAAAGQPGRSAAAGLVSAFQHSGVITGITVVYLAGHVIGFILLGVALIRSRAVPAWAGIALCLSPVAELLGEAAGLTALAAAGFALLVVAFGACAWVTVRQPAGENVRNVPSASEHVTV
jgi:hypothetical protein